MSTVVKDLGPVTAYADAVAAGYTGTKEEWQALMASYASVAEEAQEAKEGAEAAQEAAESARDAAMDAKEGAEDAVDGFGAVVTQATNQAVQTVRAEGTTQVGNVSSEGTTQVAAVQAKGTEVIQSIPADYTQLSSDVTQLKEDLTAEETARESADDAINAVLATKADTDGAIASAEQLLSDKYTIDQVPYTFRASGGDGADREYDEIVGGSIVWNQLMDKSNYPSSSGIFTNNGDGSITANGAAESTATYVFQNANLNSNHVYYVYGGNKNVGSSSTFELMVVGFTGQSTNLNLYSEATISRFVGVVGNWHAVQAVVRAGTTANNLVWKPQIIDLTAMFGSTIADYIYSLEQTTAGAGVAWFKKFFLKDYYAYDAGTMMHVSGLSSHDMVGFNAYNPTAGTAKVVGGQQYQITGTYTGLTLDGETVTPDASGYFTPDASGTLTVTGGNSTDTCVHLVWDGERDGEYEPYVKHSYALDPTVTLRGIPKTDASGNLYYDGDIWHPDGTIDRRYGIVDLGTLNWSNYIVSGGHAYQTYIPTMKLFTSSGGNVLLPNYTFNYNLTTDKTYSLATSGSGTIWIRNDSYETKEAFKAAMSGVMLVYELATPTTETATPYNEVQIVNDWGTEEYVSTSIVPVGHYTKYPANLRSAIERVMEQIPEAPSANGTYTLKATRTSSGVTYAWTAE